MGFEDPLLHRHIMLGTVSFRQHPDGAWSNDDLQLVGLPLQHITEHSPLESLPFAIPLVISEEVPLLLVLIGFEDSEDVAVAVTVEVPLGEHKRVHMAHCHNGRCSLCCRQKSSLHMITRSIHLDRADGLISPK